MSRVYVDTSAALALLVESDKAHGAAQRIFARLRNEQATLITTSYALVETYALLGRRLGLEAVRLFRSELAPLLEVIWVDAELHEMALDLMLDHNRRRLSLVDASGFVVVRGQRLDGVFAFDRDFDLEELPVLK